MKKRYVVKPLDHGYSFESAGLNQSARAAQWPSHNVMVSDNRIERRWDHTMHRTMSSGDVIQTIPVYSQYDGTQLVFALNGTDLCRVRTGTGETYQFITDTYTTGTIVSITGTTVEGDSTSWGNSGLQKGDKFITNGDHTSANKEGPLGADPTWATIDSITDNTHLKLKENYGGAATSGGYKARKVYTCPDGERWQSAVVNGYFCFVNGDVRGQYWKPSNTYATDLYNGTTYAYQARYCLGFANRLWTADLYDSSTAARNPWLVMFSKSGDPTDWTDSTAGYYTFYDSSEPITGMGIVDGQLVVYKKTQYHIGTLTGTSTDPVSFRGHFVGPGLYAPYSLVAFGGTNAWCGVDDFYIMNGNVATSIGAQIRKKFFDIVSDDDLAKVVGVNNFRFNEILWLANTPSGQIVLHWNYKNNAWYTSTFTPDLSGFGGFGS